MNRLFFLLIACVSALVGCENRMAYGVNGVASAQADALERWTSNSNRPYSFVISIRGYGEPPAAVTRVHVRESGVVRVEHLGGHKLQALAKYYRPIDDLHREMAYTLMVTQEEMVRQVMDDDQSLVVSAKFERRTGVPMEFSYMDFGFSDRSVSWTISDFEFLD